MSDKIKVAVKVRPLIARELDKKLLSHWQIRNDTIFLQDPTGKQKSEPFVFDHIFSPSSTNNHIFDKIVKPIIDAAIEGFNGTIFAYGQTSSGKTYTMTGTKANPGIIPLTIHYMFHAINQCPGREFLLRVSYMEIYNEKVIDLISLNENLPVREDSTGQVFVAVNEKVCNSPDIVLEYMSKGEKNRRFGETDVNERSSRSHTILRIILESRTSDEEDGAVKVSHLNLVDLAGSERAGQSGATGDRFKEGCHINSSLTTLGLVIKQLSEGGLDGRQFINFRDSKLTRLLQSSLGGNAMTAIICTVTPAMIDQTMDTLHFASRAKKIKNKPELNEVLSDAALIKRYRKQIAKLYEELENTKLKCVPSEVQEIENKLQQQEKLNETLLMRINRLRQALINTSTMSIPSEMRKKKYSNRRRTWGGLPEAHRMPFSAYTSTLDAICESPVKMHHSFSTANLLTDIRTPMEEFEIDLMAQEANDSIKDAWKNETNQSSVLEGNESSFFCTENNSAETPPKVLRDRIKRVSSHFEELQSEYHELRQFATLEKQIYHTDGRQLEKENQELTAKFDQLTQTVEQLQSEKYLLEKNIIQTRIHLLFGFPVLLGNNRFLVTQENRTEDGYVFVSENVIQTINKAGKDDRLSSMEKQILNFEVTSEILKKKYTEREAELKKSLEEAWATLEMKDASISQLTENMSTLQQSMKISADEDGKANKTISIKTSLIDELQDRIEQLNNEKLGYKLMLEEKNAEILEIEREHVEVCKHFNNKIKELETSLSKQISMNKIHDNNDSGNNINETNTIKKLQAEIAELQHDNYELKMAITGLVLNQEEIDDDCKVAIIEELDLSSHDEELTDIRQKIGNLVDNLVYIEYSGDQRLNQEFDLLTCAEATGLTQQIENLVDNLLNIETDYNKQEIVYNQTGSSNLQRKELMELQVNMEVKDKETTELLNQVADLLVKTEDLQKHNEELTDQLMHKKLNNEDHQAHNNMTDECFKTQELCAITQVCHIQQSDGHIGLKAVSVLGHSEDTTSNLQEQSEEIIEKLVLLETKIQEADDLRKCNEELRNQLINMETYPREDFERQSEEYKQTLALLEKVSLEKEHLAKQLEKLEEQLSLLVSKSGELEESQKHNEELLKQAAFMVVKIEDLEQFTEKLIVQADSKNSRIETLMKRNEILSEQLGKVEGMLQELEECRKQNEELLKQSAFMLVKTQDLEQYVEKLIGQKDSKESKIQILIKSNNVMNNQLDMMEGRFKDLEEYQKQNEELVKQLAFMVVKIQDLEHYTEKLLADVESRDSRIQNLKKCNDVMSEQLDTVEIRLQKVDEFQKQNEDLLKESAFMVVKIQDLEQYVEKLIGQVDSKELKIQNLEKCNEEKFKQLDIVEINFKELEECRKQNEELVKQSAFMVVKLQDLEQYAEKLIEHVESKESRIQSLVNSNKVMNEQLDIMQGRLQDFEGYEKQNEELLKQLAFMVVKIQDLEQYTEKLMGNIDSKDSRIQSLKKCSKVMSEQLDTVEVKFQELEEYRKQNEELLKQLAFMVIKIQGLQNYNAQLVEQTSDKDSKLCSHHSHNKIGLETEEMILGSQTENKITILEHKSQTASLQETNDRLIDELKTKTQDIIHLQNLNKELTNNINKKKQGVEPLKEEIIILQTENNLLEQKLQEVVKERNDMEIQINELNHIVRVQKQSHSLTDKLMDVDAKQKEISTLQKETIQLKKELKSLKHAMKDLVYDLKIHLTVLDESLNFVQNTADICVEDKQILKDIFNLEQLNSVSEIKTLIVKLKTENCILQDKLNETQIPIESEIIENVTITDTVIPEMSNEEFCLETKDMEITYDMAIPTINDATCYYNATIIEETLQSFCVSDTVQIFDNDQTIREDEQVLNKKLKAFDELEKRFYSLNTEHDNLRRINYELNEKLKVFENTCFEMYELRKQNLSLEEKTKDVERLEEEVNCLRSENNKISESLTYLEDVELKFHELNVKFNNLQNLNDELAEKVNLYECLKDEMNQLTALNTRFEEKLHEFKKTEDDLSALRVQYEKLLDMNVDLNEKLNNMEAIKNEYTALKAHVEDLEEIVKEVDSLKNEMILIRSENEKLLNINNELNEKLSALEIEYEESVKNFENMKNELISERDENKKLLNKCSDLNERLVTLGTDLEEKIQENENFKNDVTSFRSENEQLLKLNNDLSEKLITFEEVQFQCVEFQTVNADLHEKVKEFEAVENELILLRNAHEKLINVNSNLSKKLTTLVEVQKAYEELCADLEEKVKEIEVIKNDKISIEAEKQQLFMVNNELVEKLATFEVVQEEYIELKRQFAELEESVKDIEILRSDVTSFKSENEKLLNANRELKEKVVSLEAVECQYFELKALNADLEERIKDTDILRSEVKSENEKLLNTNSDLTEKLTALEAVQNKYIDLCADFEEKMKEIEVFKANKNSIEAENEKLLNLNNELHEKLIILQKVESESAELKRINSDLEERIKEIAVLKSEVASGKTENENLLKINCDLSEKLSILEPVQNKYIDLCADVEEKMKEIKILQTNKISVEAENEKLLNLNNELNEKLIILEKVQIEYAELQAMNFDLEERVKEITVLKSEVASVKNENEKVLKINCDLNEKLSTLEPIQNKYINICANVEEKMKEIEVLQTNKISVEAENKKLLNLNNELHEKLIILEKVRSEYAELKAINSDLEERIKEIVVLESEVASAKSENEKLLKINYDISEKLSTLEPVQNKYIDICTYVEEKMKEIEVLTKNKILIETENKKLLSLNNELNEKLIILEKVQSEYVELKVINSDLDKRIKEIEKLKNDVILIKTENTNLVTEIHQLKKVEHELHNLKVQHNELQKDNAHLTENLKEVNCLRKEIDDCLNEKILVIEKLQQQVSVASGEYNRLTIINNELNEKLNTFESKITCLQVENEQKCNELENANSCIKFLETENSVLCDNLKTIIHELNGQVEHEETLKDKIPILELQKNELQEKIKKLKTYESENNNLMEKLESLQNKVNELSLQNSSLKEKIKYLTELENTITVLKTENEQLSKRVALMNDMEEELNNLHTQYNNHLVQSNQFIEKLKSLERENTEFSSLNNDLQEKLKYLEGKISSLLGENEQNSEKLLLLKNVEQDFNNLNIQYNDVLAQNDELTEKLKLLENKVDEISSQNTCLHEMLKDSKNFENEILTLKTLNDELTKKISCMKNIEKDFCNLNFQFNETRTQNNELCEKLKSLENDSYNIKCENTRLKEELQSSKKLELVVEDLTRQYSTLNSDVAEKERNLEELQNEVRNLKTLNNELTKHMNDANNDLKAELAHLKESDVESNINKSTNSEMEEKITTLLEENKSLFESLEDSRQLKKTMIKEISSLNQRKTHRELSGYQLTNLYTELMSVFLGKEREVITSIQKEFDKKMFVANNRIEELQNMENKQKKWIEEIEKENDYLTKELSRTKGEKDGLNKQLTEKSNEYVVKCGEMTVIQTKLTQAQSDAANIQLELDYLRQKYKINMADVSFSDRIEELSERLNRKEKLIERIREDLNAVTVEKLKCQEINKKETEKCRTLMAAKEELTTKLADMEELNKKLTEDLQNKSKEVNKLCFEMEQKKLECDQHLLKMEEIKLNITNIINNEYKILQEKLDDNNNQSLSQKLKDIVGSVYLLKTTLELLLEKCTLSEMEHHNRINVLEKCVSEKTDEASKLTHKIENLYKQFELEKLSLSNKMSELEQSLKQKDHDIDSEKLAINSKLTELQNQIILKECEIDKLKSENLLLQNKISDIDSLLPAKLLEIKRLQELIDCKSNEYLTACNQLNEKQKCIDEINKAKHELLNKYDLLSSQSSKHLQVVEKLKCEKEKQNNEIRVLKENDDKKQKALEDLDKLIKLEKQENGKLKVKQETLLHQLEGVEKKLLLAEKNLSEYSELKSKIFILEDAKNKLQREYDDVRKIFEASEKEINAVLQKEHAQITELKSEIRENKSQLDHLLKLNRELRLENETLQNQLSCLKSSKDKETEALQSIIKQEKHDNTKLKLKQDLLTNELEEMKKKFSLEVNKMNSDKDNHFRSLQEENKELRIKIIELEEANNLNSTNNRDAQGNMDTEIVKLKKENDDLKTKIAELEEAKGYLDEECEEMFKIIQANEKEMTSVLKREEAQVTNLKSEIDKIVELNEAQLKCNKELVDENRSLKIQLSALQKTINRDGKDNMDTDIAKLKEENNDLKSKIAELEEAKGYLNEECEEMFKIIQANEKEMTSVLKREEEQVTKLKSEIDKLKEDNEAQLRRNKELTDENESLKSQLSTLNNSKDRNTLGNTDIEIAKLKEENKDLKSKFAELEEAKGYLDEECEEMFKMIQANEKEMSTVLQREHEQANKLKSEIEKLKVKVEELQSENGSLKKELKSFSDDKSKELEDLQSTIKTEKQDNRKLRLKQESCLRQLEELGYKNECLEKKLSVLEASNKSVTGECIKCNKLQKLIQASEKKTSTILSREHEQISKLKAEIVENNLKIEELIKLNKEIQNQNEVLKSELSRCENFVRELRSEKRQLLNQLTESKAKSKGFESQLSTLLKEKENVATVDTILDTDTGTHKHLNSTTGCQCEQLRKQVTQLKLNLADGNAKITGLELQIQNDYKKRVQDLEKSLDQAKHKINDLKTQVRRFQNQMNDVTVRECEVCHRRMSRRQHIETQTDPDNSMCICNVASSSGVTRHSGIVENASIQVLQGRLKEANTTIDYLKKLCRMRNAKIQALETSNKSQNSSTRSVLTPIRDSLGNIATTPKQN